MKTETFTCEKCNQTFKKIMYDEQSREQDKESSWLIKGMPQGIRIAFSSSKSGSQTLLMKIIKR